MGDFDSHRTSGNYNLSTRINGSHVFSSNLFQIYAKTRFVNVKKFLHATPDFLTSCDCCRCGEVKCPICILDCDFDKYIQKKSSCLEKVKGTFKLKGHTIITSRCSSSCLLCQRESLMTLLSVQLTLVKMHT